jgi:hypothetical protein
MSERPQQTPSVGRMVHFVHGAVHCAAIITDPAFQDHGIDGLDDMRIMQSLAVFPPNSEPFTTIAAYDASAAPATWHWPEYVP